MSRDPSLTRVLPRLVPALAALLMLGIFLGCMSLNIGSRVCSELEGEVLEQCGQVNVRPDEEQLVYYPIPYASPPNLTLERCFPAEYARIIDQQADHFRILVTGFTTPKAVEIDWTARGIPAPRVAPTPAVPVPPPCPPPGPPIVPDPPNP
jgi:hypothetical protein